MIATSAQEGMISMDQSLYTLVQKDVVAAETALRYSMNPESLRRRLQSAR